MNSNDFNYKLPDDGDVVFEAICNKNISFLKDVIRYNSDYTYRAFALLGYQHEFNKDVDPLVLLKILAVELNLSKEDVVKITKAYNDAIEEGIFGLKKRKT